MPSHLHLFRDEVISEKRNQHVGLAFIRLPTPYKGLAIGISVLVCLLAIFLIVAKFSKKTMVVGYLNSSKGVSKIYPIKEGILAKSYCSLGQLIHKGEPLFKIDTSFERHQGNRLQLKQLQQRKRSLERELQYQKTNLMTLKSLLIKHFISEVFYHEKKEIVRDLNNKINDVSMEITQFKQNQSYIIYAPLTGYIANMNVYAGQFISLNKPLAMILPSDAAMELVLFVPVKKAGFLKKNDRVIVRYDAYPYSSFGSYDATIQAISQSPSTDDEESNPIKISQPFYKVTAHLAKQRISVYGHEQPLKQGMTVSAIIVGEKKSLWQWIIEPLTSFKGQLI